MSFQPVMDGPPQLLIQLEILTEHADEADLALLSAVGRDAIDDLRAGGSTVQPASTGQRGGDVLVNVMTTLTTIAASAWTHKEIVLADLGGLVTVCGGIVSVGKTVLQAFKKRASAENAQERVKMTVEIDGAPVTVEAADLEQAEAALIVAKRFHTHHPDVAKQVTAQSKVKLKTHVPKAPRRKRR